MKAAVNKNITKPKKEKSLCKNGKTMGFDQLMSHKIRHWDGGLRIHSAEKTVQRIKKSDPNDIVCLDMIRVDSLDRIGIPVYCTIAHFTPDINQNKPTVHWGKGYSPIQAQASALAETIERFSSRVFSHTPLIQARYKDVASCAINPRHLITDSEEASHRHVPFDENMLVHWRWGYDLLKNSPILIPAICVHFPFDIHENRNFANQSTNGLAAGNCLEEAILQSLLELIERDATYIILRNRICTPDVVVDSIKDNTLSWTIQRIRDAQMGVYIKDFTTDIGIPVMGVLITDTVNKNGLMIAHGYGAHLDPKIALMRALTEAAQVRCFYLKYLKELPHKRREKFCSSHFLFDNKAKDIFDCMLRPGSHKRDFSDIPNLASNELSNSLELCMNKVKKVLHDSSIFAVNLTHLEIDFPVVKVIVPELQNIDHEHLNISKRMFFVPRLLGYTHHDTTVKSLYRGKIP